MNRHLVILITLLMLCSAPFESTAQRSKPKTKKPDKTAKAAPLSEAAKPEAASKDSKPAAPAGDKAAAGSAMGGFDFNRIVARKIIYDPSGKFTLDGNVIVESDQINIDCSHLNVDPDKKSLIATGSPVKIRQGDTMQAECQNFVYDTEKKTSKLTGHPVIHKKEADGKVTNVTAPVIDLFQNAKGDWGFITDTDNTGVLPEITKTGGAKPKTAEKKDTKAEKVGENNLDAIKSPVVE